MYVCINTTTLSYQEKWAIRFRALASYLSSSQTCHKLALHELKIALNLQFVFDHLIFLLHVTKLREEKKSVNICWPPTAGSSLSISLFCLTFIERIVFHRHEGSKIWCLKWKKKTLRYEVDVRNFYFFRIHSNVT